MAKVKQKRYAHGTTSLMVMDALVKLHTKGGQRVPVSRAALLAALQLQETTVDDRLRTLVKEGRIWRVGRALYQPKAWPGQEMRQSETPGKKRMTVFPDGVVLEEVWRRGK